MFDSLIFNSLMFASPGDADGLVIILIIGIIGYVLSAIFCQEKMTPEERKRREDDSLVASEFEKNFEIKVTATIPRFANLCADVALSRNAVQ